MRSRICIQKKFKLIGYTIYLIVVNEPTDEDHFIGIMGEEYTFALIGPIFSQIRLRTYTFFFSKDKRHSLGQLFSFAAAFAEVKQYINFIQ